MRTLVGVNDQQAVKRWAAATAVAINKNSYFGKRMVSEGREARTPIQQINDLQEGAGDEVTLDLLMPSNAEPIVKDQTLDGKDATGYMRYLDSNGYVSRTQRQERFIKNFYEDRQKDFGLSNAFFMYRLWHNVDSNIPAKDMAELAFDFRNVTADNINFYILPGETLIFPGHDYGGRTVSTVDEERRRNATFTGLSRDRFIEHGRKPALHAAMQGVVLHGLPVGAVGCLAYRAPIHNEARMAPAAVTSAVFHCVIWLDVV